MLWDRWTDAMDQSSNTDIKWGWKAYAIPASRLCFCSSRSGFSLEDFYMVTELSGYNVGVAFFKTLISRSYLINFLITGGFLWLARTVCYSQLNLTSDRLLSDSMWSMPPSAN